MQSAAHLEISWNKIQLATTVSYQIEVKRYIQYIRKFYQGNILYKIHSAV